MATIDIIVDGYMQQRALLNADLKFCFTQRGAHRSADDHYYDRRIEELDKRIAGIDKIIGDIACEQQALAEKE